MNIVIAKWVILVVLFVSTALFSMVPILLRNFVRSNLDSPNSRCRLMISLLNCFAGGVFMATGLLDIFPEVDEALIKASWDHGYPVAEFLVAVGFFVVLTVEQIVLHYKEQVNPASERSEEEGLIEPHRDDLHDSQYLRPSGMVGVSNHPLVSSTASNVTSITLSESDPHSSFRTLLLAAALSLHSVFEGLAIGLQPDIDKLVQIFIAVSLHKSVIAFSLGLNLIQSELKIWTIVESNLAFCLASPIGLGLTLVLEKFGYSVDTSALNGILQGLACGTFFYVTFFEVLPHELNLGGYRLQKLLAIIFGFSVVSGVLFLDPDNQSIHESQVALQLNSAIYPHLM